MSWQLLLVSFGTVFLSELGDKSQLAAIALGGSTKSPQAVFLGSALALVLASGLGVLLGHGAGVVLPTIWVKGLAAAGFLIMGLRLLLTPVETDQGGAQTAQVQDMPRHH